MRSSKSLQKYHEALDACKVAIQKVQETTKRFDNIPKGKILITKLGKLIN